MPNLRVTNQQYVRPRDCKLAILFCYNFFTGEGQKVSQSGPMPEYDIKGYTSKKNQFKKYELYCRV